MKIKSLKFKMLEFLNLKFRNYLGFRIISLGFIILLFSFFFFPSSARAGVIMQRPLYFGLNQGLVGSWTFDGPDMSGNTAFDRSGQGNTGTLTNGPTRAIGRIGQALSFDGINDYVDAGSNSSIDDLDYFTYTAWIYVKSFPDGDISHIISQGPNDRLCQIDNRGGASGDNTLRMSLDRAVDTNLIAVDNSLRANTWHHIACVFDLSGTQRLYIDGSEPSYQTNTQGSGALTDDPAQSVLIADDSTPAGIPFNGLIDDARVYNRALSPDEIKRLYNIGATFKIGPHSKRIGSYGRPNIAFDAASSNSGSSVTSLTFRHTTSGSNRLLVVGTVSVDTAAADRIVSSITYGGKSLTNIRTDETGNRRTELWYLANPPLGENNIVVSMGGTVTAVSAGGISLTGVDQGDPLDAQNGTTNVTASTIIVSLTTKVDNVWVVDVVGSDSTVTEYTADAGQTEQWQNLATNADGAGSTKGPVSPQGATTMGWSFPANENTVMSAAAFRPTQQVIVNKPVAGGTLKNGLVGYWSFDGPDMSGNTAFDRSGQGNTGTLTNGPTRAIGRIGQALDFDGVDDRVLVADASSLDFERTDPFSLSLWFRDDVGGFKVLLSKLESASTQGWELNTTFQKIGIFICNNYSTNCVEVTMVNTYTLNTWHHVNVVYNGNSNASGVNVYIDGSLQALTTNQNNLSATILNDDSLRISSRNNQNYHFNGIIDDVRIYNRALSSDEIKRLYNMGR